MRGDATRRYFIKPRPAPPAANSSYWRNSLLTSERARDHWLTFVGASAKVWPPTAMANTLAGRPLGEQARLMSLVARGRDDGCSRRAPASPTHAVETSVAGQPAAAGAGSGLQLAARRRVWRRASMLGALLPCCVDDARPRTAIGCFLSPPSPATTTTAALLCTSPERAMLTHRAAALRPAAAAARTALRLRVSARSVQCAGLPTSRASASTWAGASRRSPPSSAPTYPDPGCKSNSHTHSGTGTGARRVRGPYHFSDHSAGVGGSVTRTSSSSTAWLSDESSGSDSAVDEPAPSSGRKGVGFTASAPALRRAVRRASPLATGSHPLTSKPMALVTSSLPPFAPELPAALVRHAALQGRPYSTGKTAPPSVLKEHLRMHWPAYAAVAGCVTLGGWYFYTDPAPKDGTRSISTSSPATFSVRSKAQGGGYKVVTALAPDEVDNVLRAHERSTRVDRPPGACRVARFDTNSVASNAPCEDKRAEVIVERDWPAPGSHADKGDLCFFAVMDGHAGAATSTLLAQKLIPFVALELDKLFRQAAEYAQMTAQKNQGGSWLSLGGLLGKSSPRPPGPHPPAASPESDPDLVERALRTAFLNLDKEICATPVELLHEYEISLAALPSASLPQGRVVSASSSAPAPDAAGSSTLGDKGFKTLFNSRPPEQEGPSLDARQKAAYAALRPAMNGSCALLTYIDSARGDVYVACTGDSRAVGGFWDAKAGVWTFEPLSVDQTGRNLDEVARMRSEHPPQEADQVIMRGRVLGGLEPTRAFGDAVYKWDRSLQERLYDAFVPGGVTGARRIPRLLRTPPYVTPEPLVQVRRLAPLAPGMAPDTVASGSPQAGKQLRFIVMATDGLWDMLPNEEVGALVAGHLAGLKGDVRADALMAQVLEGAPHSLALSGTASPVQAKEGDNPLTPAAKGEQIFTFADENLSTHLIRNALGGAHRDRVAGLLAIPAPESRRYRDDMTVNVILLHDEPVSQTSTEVGGEPLPKL